MPAAWGAKVTFTVTLCPGSKVKGSVGPLTENPLPDVPSFDMVKFEEREFVSTTGTVELVPIATWPNDTLEGLEVPHSLRVPAPETATASVSFDALLEKLMVPYVHPVIVGVKTTLRSTLCPAGKTSGSVNLDVVNWALPAVIAEIVTLVGP